tara:strand:+ start:303 stop:959 length:657 start_codon:yes stop_codon:yes gene_type:complete
MNTEELSKEEIIERLEASERSVGRLKDLLQESLTMVNQLHTKQMDMQKESFLIKESGINLAGSIANFITLDAQQVAKAVVNEKSLNKDLDDLINAIKKDVENRLSDLGSGKVTDELVKKVIDHIDTDVIAETIAEGDIESDIASYIDAENVAYHIDVSDVAGYVHIDDVAGCIDHGDVAGYIEVDASDVAQHVEIDLDDLAGRIDLDALAELLKDRVA